MADRNSPDPTVRCEAAVADSDAGRDLTWARVDADIGVRRAAAWADRVSGRDMAWARCDADPLVRHEAARADRDAGRSTIHPRIGEFEAWSYGGLLTVGCESNTYRDWLERADEIDEAHGSPGYAAEIRALAQRLLDEEVARGK